MILGVGFFLKHAFEHDWIGPRGRVLAGLAAGIVMMAGGARLAGRGAYQVPAQSLIALGMGVLYLSLYAAHALYALVGATPAFLGMALVTAAGFATALRLDAVALATLATIGGLLTPVILATDTDAAAALFTYLLILDVGVLLAATLRGWSGVALLAFAGTQALYWGWFDRWYEVDRWPGRARMGDGVLPGLRGRGAGGSADPPSGRHGRARADPCSSLRRPRSTSPPLGASSTRPDVVWRSWRSRSPASTG